MKLTDQIQQFRAIPHQLDQVSQDVTKILVTVSLLALLALLVASAALVVASNGN
jgi:hypothetical protein